jgi:endonuclease/exonuclease/phosphatase family metal-dependent hydrolase
VRLVVTTWNLQGSKGVDVGTVVSHVRAQGSDVLLLQEVQRGQARRLARALGARSRSWGFKHWPLKIPAEGMAVVGVSFPLRARARGITRRLRWWSWRRRIVQVAQVRLGGRRSPSGAGGQLAVVNVHLSPHEVVTTRGDEVASAHRLISDGDGEVATPAILAGDFNDLPDSTVCAQLTGHELRDAWLVARPAGTDPGFTNWYGVARRKPANRRIDYVWVSSDVTVVAAHVPTPDDPDWLRYGKLSDHLPLTVTLEVSPG